MLDLINIPSTKSKYGLLQIGKNENKDVNHKGRRREEVLTDK